MTSDPFARNRLRKVLVVVILATIPCYCTGLVAVLLAPGNLIRSPGTPTPSYTWTPLVTLTPTINFTSLPFVTITSGPTSTTTSTGTATSTPTITPTPSITATPSPSNTPFMPPTFTKTPYYTATFTRTPTSTVTFTPTKTLGPSPTDITMPTVINPHSTTEPLLNNSTTPQPVHYAPSLEH
jgi:hypothetical protein